MYLADALDVVVRRWILVAIGLVLTAAAVAFALGHVASSYQANSQVVLLQSAAASGTNPYVDFPEGLETTATILAADATSKDTRRDMEQQGLDADYDVSMAPDAGPLLVITATSDDPDIALATRDAVMQLMATTLSRMQSDAGVPATQTVSAQPADVSAEAEELPGSKLRALVATAAAGLLVSLFAILLIDRLLERRAGRPSPETGIAGSTGISGSAGSSGSGGPGGLVQPISGDSSRRRSGPLAG